MRHTFDLSAVREIRPSNSVEYKKSPLGLGETEVTVDAPKGIDVELENGILYILPEGDMSSSSSGSSGVLQYSQFNINLKKVEGLHIGGGGDDDDDDFTARFNVNLGGRPLVTIKAPQSIPIVQ
jgi:hypothetical protein